MILIRIIIIVIKAAIIIIIITAAIFMTFLLRKGTRNARLERYRWDDDVDVDDEDDLVIEEGGKDGEVGQDADDDDDGVADDQG